MTYKFFEIRDRATMIPALGFTTNAMDENDAGHFLLRHSGFRPVSDCIFLVKLQTGGAEYDPYSWSSGCRTMSTALRESKAPKVSERLEA